jgi:MOSC domain-containing protein YiiM
MGEVCQLFLSIGSRLPMRGMGEVLAVTDGGLKGCRHGRPGSRRQVLLMNGETLEQFGLAPGQLKENITTRGLQLGSLVRGERLAVGEVVLEITGPCDPCSRMDEIRMGLQQALQGRRGILCRVVQGGRIRRSDGIRVLSASAAEERGGKI